jgi:hypothetical protein
VAELLQLMGYKFDPNRRRQVAWGSPVMRAHEYETEVKTETCEICECEVGSIA